MLTSPAYAVSCHSGRMDNPHTLAHTCLCFKSHGSTRAPNVTQGVATGPKEDPSIESVGKLGYDSITHAALGTLSAFYFTLS